MSLDGIGFGVVFGCHVLGVVKWVSSGVLYIPPPQGEVVVVDVATMVENGAKYDYLATLIPAARAACVIEYPH